MNDTSLLINGQPNDMATQQQPADQSMVQMPTTEQQPQAAPQAPTQPVTATPQQTTINIQEHQKDLDLINSQLESIKQNETSLKTILGQLDDRLEKAKNIALAARKKSMDILNQTAQADAQRILDEINQSFQEISKIQQESQNDANVNFQATTDKIQATIKEVQNAIAQLQSKGVELKLAQEKATIPTTTPEQKKQAFRSWFIAEKNGSEPGVDKTFVHYIFNRTADLISGAFRVIAASYHVIKDAVWGAQQKPAPIQQPTQQSTPQPAPTSEPQPTMPLAAAGTPPAAATMDPSSIKTLLDSQEQIVSDLYKIRYDCTTKLKEISIETKNIISTLASNPIIKSYIPVVDISVIHPTEEPSWKKHIVQGFSKLLDGLIYGYNTVAFYVKYAFKSYISPLFNKFKQDLS